MGVMDMEDEKGGDAKLIALVACEPRTLSIIDIHDVPMHVKSEIQVCIYTYSYIVCVGGGGKGGGGGYRQRHARTHYIYESRACMNSDKSLAVYRNLSPSIVVTSHLTPVGIICRARGWVVSAAGKHWQPFRASLYLNFFLVDPWDTILYYLRQQGSGKPAALSRQKKSNRHVQLATTNHTTVTIKGMHILEHKSIVSKRHVTTLHLYLGMGTVPVPLACLRHMGLVHTLIWLRSLSPQDCPPGCPHTRLHVGSWKYWRACF
jgi:hypothetical protein